MALGPIRKACGGNFPGLGRDQPGRYNRILANLGQVAEDLAAGAIVVLHEVVVEDASAPSRDGPLEFGNPASMRAERWLRRFTSQVTVSLSTTSKAPQT